MNLGRFIHNKALGISDGFFNGQKISALFFRRKKGSLPNCLADCHFNLYRPEASREMFREGFDVF
jgi:hypothetical protein